MKKDTEALEKAESEKKTKVSMAEQAKSKVADEVRKAQVDAEEVVRANEAIKAIEARAVQIKTKAEADLQSEI